MIPELKNYNLMYQVYVPIEIFEITGNVVNTLQNGYDKIARDVIKVINKEEINEEEIKKYEEEVLKDVAFSNTIIRRRLKQLSEIQK